MDDFRDDNGVVFEQDAMSYQAPARERRRKGMIGFLVDHGMAADEMQANVILVGLIVCLFITSGGVFYFGMRTKPIPDEKTFLELTPPSVASFKQ